MAQVSPRIFIQAVKEFPIFMQLDCHLLSSQNLFKFARHVALFLQKKIYPISRNQNLRVQGGYTIPENYRCHIAECRWREERDIFHRSRGIKALTTHKFYEVYIRDNFSFSEILTIWSI